MWSVPLSWPCILSAKQSRANARCSADPAAESKAKSVAATKDSLASAAAAARRELGLATGRPSENGVAKAAKSPAAAEKPVRTYDEHMAAKQPFQAPQVSL